MFSFNSVRVAPGVRSAVALACSMATFSGGAAWGAVAEDSVEPVIVSASRMPQLLQTAPIGATVITAEQIKRSGVADANEAIRKIGGVAGKSDLNNGRENRLDLRGYGETADSNVVVLVDGIRVSENELASARLSAIPLDQIDRIEILRGGSSVMWGEGASAGVINVILKRPQGSISSGRVSAAVESFNGHDLQGVGQLGLGNTVLEASARRLRTDGYRENSGYKQDTGSVGLQWSDKAWRAHFRVQQENVNARLPGYLTLDEFAANPRKTNKPNDFASTRETRYTGNLEYQFEAWTAQLDLGVRERESASFMFGGLRQSASTSRQISPRLNYRKEQSGVAMSWVLGLDWQRWSFELPATGGLEQGHQASDASFVHGDITFPSKTRLALGARKERIHKDGDVPPGFAPALIYQRSDSLTATEISASQTLLPSLDIYARLASSFRLPNVDENRSTPGAAPLRPQRNRDRELGMKWSKDRDSATLRVFNQNTVDEIAYVDIVGANTNLVPTKRHGVEIEGRWNVVPKVDLTATWQQVSAEFRQGPDAGKNQPLVASHTGTLRAALRVDDHQTVDLGFQYMASMPYQDDQCTKWVPSSTFFDARYAWSDQGWTIALSGTNLANKQGYNYAYSFACSAIVYPYSGRALKLTVSRQF